MDLYTGHDEIVAMTGDLWVLVVSSMFVAYNLGRGSRAVR